MLLLSLLTLFKNLSLTSWIRSLLLLLLRLILILDPEGLYGVNDSDFELVHLKCFVEQICFIGCVFSWGFFILPFSCFDLIRVLWLHQFCEFYDVVVYDELLFLEKKYLLITSLFRAISGSLCL